MTDQRAAGGGNTTFIAPLFDASLTDLSTLRCLRVIYTVILALPGLAVLVWVALGAWAGGARAVLLLIIGGAVSLLHVVLVRVSREVIAVLSRIGENTNRMAEALKRRG